MPKAELMLGSGDYAPVADRITLFCQRYPDGRIVTDLVSHVEREVVFKASIFRTAVETSPAATGWASEREGDGDVNTVACLENTETSAIGRALANLGFTASSRRPSLEEMEKAARTRARLERAAGPDTGEASSRTGPTAEEWDSRQRHADVVSDALMLIRSAERHGMRRRRADAATDRLLSGSVPEQEVARIAQRLRQWLRAQVVRDVGSLHSAPARHPRAATADVTSPH